MSGITFQTFERDFRIQRQLGKGNYATVYQVRHLIDQRLYAFKCMELATLQELSQAFNEIETIKCIDDNRIVKVLFYYTREMKKTNKYQFGLIMDLCSFSLADSIKLKKRKNEYISIQQLRQFLTTMIPFFAKMQRKGILHRDIKPDNILIIKKQNNMVEYKVADFGFAIMVNAYSQLNVAGTIEYVSPKLLVKFKNSKAIVPGHTFKDDVYSFGKTIYEFMTLDLSGTLNPKKMLELSTRYGPQYPALVKLMVQEQENQRPDFLYLQSYTFRKNLIDSASSEDKQSLLSISTVSAGKQSKNSTNLLAKSQVSKSKLTQMTKTRRKDTENDSDITRIQDLSTSRYILKTSRVKDIKDTKDTIKKTVIFQDDIKCLFTSKNYLFIGSYSKIGIFQMKTEKTIKLNFTSANKPVTWIKADLEKNLLFFSNFQGIIFMINLTEIDKLFVDCKDLFKKRNQVEIIIKDVKFKNIQLDLPISTFDVFYPQGTAQPLFICGHFTGEKSIVDMEQNKIIKCISNAPITKIAYNNGFIYSTNGEGVFKRQNLISLGVWDNKRQQGKLNSILAYQKTKMYKYQDCFTTFQLIPTCKYNNSVTKEEHKYLAIIISYDGFAHIVSNSMRLEKLVRLSHNNILQACFQINTASNIGLNCFAMDSAGKVFNQNGDQISRYEEKNGLAIAAFEGNVYIGSKGKGLLIFDNEQAVVLDS